MNQNLQDAPVLPPHLPMNIYGVSLGRWHYKGFYYGPDRNPIPEQIAAMEDEEQAAIMLKNYLEQESQRQFEMSEAAEAEAEKERQAAQEAEDRDLQELDEEIERRAQSRAAEIIAAAQEPTPVDPSPPTPVVEEPEDVPEHEEGNTVLGTRGTDAPATAGPGEAVGSDAATSRQNLAEILSNCTTKAQLEEQLASVQWQHITRAVERVGKTPGKKTENIAILAEHLGLE